MILVDTSVWIDHLRTRENDLVTALSRLLVLCHPFVIGELACGSIAHRGSVLQLLGELPAAPVAAHEEVMEMIARRALHGRGIGWVDAHLLSSTLLMPGCRLWTRDRRLAELADELSIRHASSE